MIEPQKARLENFDIQKAQPYDLIYVTHSCPHRAINTPHLFAMARQSAFNSTFSHSTVIISLKVSVLQFLEKGTQRDEYIL